ncbi:E3 ubiquitin-protein ligase RNF34 [Pelomyxa schiedti]|nr:E3 ubiquitin-protein ligase RNF34 [Pelomyxa schiedti]
MAARLCGKVIAYTSNGKVCVMHHGEDYVWKFCSLHDLQPCPACVGQVSIFVGPAAYHFFFLGVDGQIHEFHFGAHNNWKVQHACVNDSIVGTVRPPRITCDPVLLAGESYKHLYFTAEDGGVWEMHFGAHTDWKWKYLKIQCTFYTLVLMANCKSSIKETIGSHNNWQWQGFSLGSELHLPKPYSAQFSCSPSSKCISFLHGANDIYELFFADGYWKVTNVTQVLATRGKLVPVVSAVPRIFSSENQHSIVICCGDGSVAELHEGSHNSWEWDLFTFLKIGAGEVAIDSSGLIATPGTKHIFFRSASQQLCEFHMGGHNHWTWEFFNHAQRVVSSASSAALAPVESPLNVSTYMHPMVSLPISGFMAPSTDINNNMCKVCFISPINTVVLECGHRVMCHMCASKIPGNICPLCRAPITRIVHTFDS